MLWTGTKMTKFKGMIWRLKNSLSLPFLRFKWNTWPAIKAGVGKVIGRIGAFFTGGLTGLKLGAWLGTVTTLLTKVITPWVTAVTGILNIGIKAWLLGSKSGRRRLKTSSIGGGYYGGFYG